MYKITKPFNSSYLQVSNIHKIYFEEIGNPHGIPIVFLHGGPGGQFKSKHKKIFNPKKFRVILFDQRGCGKSLPFGELKENTTSDLIKDIEKLRNRLQIEKWIVYGRSWGSTLGLIYAEKYPTSVTKLILGGVFLARKKDEELIYKQKWPSFVYPELWEQVTKLVKGDVVKFMQKNINGNEYEQKLVASIFSLWEGGIMRPYRKPETIFPKLETIDGRSISMVKILWHYIKNHHFIEENQILNNIKKIKNIKTIIIQGRCDFLTPVYQAWELHKQLPHSKLDIVELAGHSSSQTRIQIRIKYWLDNISI